MKKFEDKSRDGTYLEVEETMFSNDLILEIGNKKFKQREAIILNENNVVELLEYLKNHVQRKVS